MSHSSKLLLLLRARHQKYYTVEQEGRNRTRITIVPAVAVHWARAQVLAMRRLADQCVGPNTESLVQISEGGGRL